jgi:uncharacterized SAM-dependent methyltransferase
MPKLGFFPGSTIGNMIARTSVDLLRAMRESLGVGSLLLIGMDRIKGEDVLVPAYDDAQGVTAAFNLNLLDRINRELDGTIPVDAFRHRAIWNDLYARGSRCISKRVRDVTFTSRARAFDEAGETIHTENSHKYGQRDAHPAACRRLDAAQGMDRSGQYVRIDPRGGTCRAQRPLGPAVIQVMPGSERYSSALPVLTY